MGSTVLTLEETIELIRKQLPEYDRKAIMKMIEEKRQELGPEVVNEESAAMIVARELGIDLQQVSVRARQKIEDITESTRNVTITAKVVHVGTVRTFAKKDGGEGKVASLKVADETGEIRVTLWDDMTKVVEEEAEETVSVGDVIQIRGAYVKKGLRDALELNLGRMGGIRILGNKELEDFDIEIGEPKSNNVADLAEGLYDLTLTVKVERVFNVSTFTRKKDGSEGKVLSMIVGDDTGTTRFVFWDDHAEAASEIQEGEVIKLTGGMTRAGRNESEIEVHAGRSSTIERNLDKKIKVKAEERTIPAADPLGRMTIADMKVGMRDVDLEGKVFRIFPPNQFEKDGKSGQVQNIIIADESGKTVRTAFWNEDVDKIQDLNEGDVIKVLHGYVKKGYRDDIEYGVGRSSEIEINPKGSKLAKLELEGVKVAPTSSGRRTMIADIDDSSEGSTLEVCGIVVAMGQNSPVYPACPTCRKKVEFVDDGYKCKECGDVDQPDYRMLYKITIDDGSGTIRATLFGEAGEELLGMTANEAQDLIDKSKNEKAPIDKNSDRVLGSYVVVKGRISKYREQLDITASSLSFADPATEIERMKTSIEDYLG
ncbi:MAG: OB-fold nucleic acid binding domain-containing protein [Candidatus Thorarchaeota archaeon]|nr:OB-fold nucleic acid binding domain-containing protein [Candidatus Thorarchaeota archaeon]